MANHQLTKNNIASTIKNVPALRFSEFSDEWEKRKIDDISDVTSGGTPSRSIDDYWGGGIPWVSTSQINFNEIFYSNEYISQKGLDNSSAKLFPIDTILIAMYGQGKTRGKIAILKIEATTNQACAALIPYKSINSSYLFHYLSGKYEVLRRLSNDGGQKNLSGGLIKKLVIYFSHKKEQQKIAKFLSAVDSKIEQLAKKKALLEQYKKGMMQKLFPPADSGQISELRFKDEQGNDYPDWEKKKLGDIAELTSSKRVYLSNYVDIGIPFYRGKEISELRNGLIPSDILYITEKCYEDFKEKFGVPLIGDILITAVGTLGNVLRIKTDDKFYFKDGNLIWLRKIQEDSIFLEFLLQWHTRNLIKTSIGSTQKALTMVELRKLYFLFPTLEEQQKIASYLSSLDNKIDQINTQLEKTKTFKKGLLQQMFV